MSSSRAPAGGTPDPPPDARHGLCPSCRHVKVIRSARGSTFYLCTLAGKDPAFRKYPPQPVLACPGHER